MNAARLWFAATLGALACALALAFLVVKLTPKKVAPLDTRKAALHSDMDQAIAGLSARLPQRIDDETILQSVARQDDTIVYRYKLELAGQAARSGAFARLADRGRASASFIAKACADPETFASLMSGARLRYSYSDKDGAMLGEFDLDAHDCAAQRR
ncbi:MAG: hypothetical protein KGL46_01710 [Hyphomicrobiales bacterium]|nr:hypothetical protein [Hyphomicrobiales bacterium]